MALLILIQCAVKTKNIYSFAELVCCLSCESETCTIQNNIYQLLTTLNNCYSSLLCDVNIFVKIFNSSCSSGRSSSSSSNSSRCSPSRI